LIYQYIDIVPAKVIFRIEKTSNLELLKPYFDGDLNTVWQEIEKEHQHITPDKDDKSLDLYKNIEGLRAKYEAILLSVKYLSQLWDNELADFLISLGYDLDKEGRSNLQDVSKIKEHQDQIEIISKQSEGILFKINNALSRLEKTKGKTKKVEDVSFEQTVMSYSSFLRSGYIDPNKITLVEYYALISLGVEKIKALEKINTKGGKAK
jgi:hypothetical protein